MRDNCFPKFRNESFIIVLRIFIRKINSAQKIRNIFVEPVNRFAKFDKSKYMVLSKSHSPMIDKSKFNSFAGSPLCNFLNFSLKVHILMKKDLGSLFQIPGDGVTQFVCINYLICICR